MATDTHTNNGYVRGIVDKLTGRNMATVATSTPAVETPQAKGARTRTTRDNRIKAMENDIRILTDTVTKFIQNSQPAPTPQAQPQAAPTRAQVQAESRKRTTRRRAAASQPRPQARTVATGELSPSNLAAVNAALAAKGCGCTAAFTRKIWAANGVAIRKDADGKDVQSIHYPNRQFAWLGGRIMQVWCEHQVEAATDTPTAQAQADDHAQDAATDARAQLLDLLREALS